LTRDLEFEVNAEDGEVKIAAELLLAEVPGYTSERDQEEIVRTAMGVPGVKNVVLKVRERAISL
jgi:hypothetical protein